jgi:gliding motility-associated-like protein
MYKHFILTTALAFSVMVKVAASPITDLNSLAADKQLTPDGGGVPPVANVDNVVGVQNRDIVIDALANDSIHGNLQGNPTIAVQAQHGTAVWSNAEQAFIYTPTANYCGSDAFSYVITNDSLLSDTAVVNINITCIDSVTVYNGISPNGDGYNDYLTVANIESFPNNTMYIYNRWGNLVFQTKSYSNVDPAKRFNGQFDGTDLADGTYFYVLRFVNRQNVEEIHNGFVVINR